MLKRNNVFGAAGTAGGGVPCSWPAARMPADRRRRRKWASSRSRRAPLPSPTSCRAAPPRTASPKSGRRSRASCRSACSSKAARSRRASSCSRSTPGSYRAALSSAQAALKRAEAQAVSAKLLQERYAPLMAANAVSQQENDEAIAARARAEADVAEARAAVDTARINVVYTQVLSPITGRIGRALVTEGALVTSAQQNALATVQQLDPIYVDITQSSTELLRLQRQLESGELVRRPTSTKRKSASRSKTARRTPSAAASRFPKCRWTRARARCCCAPCSRIRSANCCPACSCAPSSRAARAPRRCSCRNAACRETPRAKPPSWWSTSDDKVNERVVTADRAINGEWLITAGLAAGERVVLDGLQKIKPGVPVKAVPAAEQLNAADAGERRRRSRASASQRFKHAVPFLHRPAHLRVGHRHHRHDRGRRFPWSACRCGSTRPSRRRRSAST